MLTPAAGVRLLPTYWLWADRIPAGALTLGPGREGIGKSLFCAWLTAHVTRGCLPGIHEGRPRSVIYAATEDSWERTIAGRLHTAGADLDRVLRVEVVHLDGALLPLSLPRDCDQLAAQIPTHDVALLVLDPLISAIDARINVNSEELRGALEPLARLADQTGAAVFGLAHFNKASGVDALSRVTGSRAFSAVSRAAVAFARDPNVDDGSTCVLSQIKSNLGRLDLPSLRYRIESIQLDTSDGPGQWGRLVMLGETDTHVETLLTDTGKDVDDGDDPREVVAWLLSHLGEHGGQVPANAVYTQARDVGFSRDQVKRAKHRINKTDPAHRVELTKDGPKNPWVWKLTDRDQPGSKGAHREQGSTPR